MEHSSLPCYLAGFIDARASFSLKRDRRSSDYLPRYTPVIYLHGSYEEELSVLKDVFSEMKLKPTFLGIHRRYEHYNAWRCDMDGYKSVGAFFERVPPDRLLMRREKAQKLFEFCELKKRRTQYDPYCDRELEIIDFFEKAKTGRRRLNQWSSIA